MPWSQHAGEKRTISPRQSFEPHSRTGSTAGRAPGRSPLDCSGRPTAAQGWPGRNVRDQQERSFVDVQGGGDRRRSVRRNGLECRGSRPAQRREDQHHGGRAGFALHRLPGEQVHRWACARSESAGWQDLPGVDRSRSVDQCHVVRRRPGFLRRVQLPGKSRFGPAITAGHGVPIVAWADAANGELKIMKNLNGTVVSTGETCSAAPALTFIPELGDSVIVAWTGTSAQRTLNVAVWDFATVPHIGQKVTLPDSGSAAATSIAGPSIAYKAAFQAASLMMGWVGLPGGNDHDNHLNVIFSGNFQIFASRETFGPVTSLARPFSILRGRRTTRCFSPGWTNSPEESIPRLPTLPICRRYRRERSCGVTLGTITARSEHNLNGKLHLARSAPACGIAAERCRDYSEIRCGDVGIRSAVLGPVC